MQPLRPRAPRKLLPEAFHTWGNVFRPSPTPAGPLIKNAGLVFKKQARG